MQQIAVMNAKGGVGKTTIVDELAFWMDRNAGPVPGVDSGPIYQIADADGQGGLLHTPGRQPTATITIVDLPGELMADDAVTARESDVIVVPFLNSARDVAATEATLRMIAGSGSEAIVILVVNHWRARTAQDRMFAREGLRDWLNELNRDGALPRVAAVRLLPDSVGFTSAAMAGVSVVQRDPRSPAARATDELCAAVWEAAMVHDHDIAAYKRACAARWPQSEWTLLERR